jgi:hypothetical protein
LALSYYCCSNCGFWQRRPVKPVSCPVCEDVRHVLPEGGFEFLSPEEVDGGVECSWEKVGDGIWRCVVEPKLGIGPSGYLVETESGNVAFEGAGACARRVHPPVVVIARVIVRLPRGR